MVTNPFPHGCRLYHLLHFCLFYFFHQLAPPTLLGMMTVSPFMIKKIVKKLALSGRDPSQCQEKKRENSLGSFSLSKHMELFTITKVGKCKLQQTVKERDEVTAQDISGLHFCPDFCFRSPAASQ